MPRRIEVSVPLGEAEMLSAELAGMGGLISMQIQPGISRKPPGDIIILDVTNDELASFMRVLAAKGFGSENDRSLSTSEPVSIVSASSAKAILRDSSEATWEEMELVIGKNSNMTGNALLVMLAAGVLAAIGIATNALHIVIGAMLIAPGFQPIVRIALGIAGGSRASVRGLIDTGKGYIALSFGAGITALLLQAAGERPLGTEASYLPAGVLITYWTTITMTSIVVAAVAGISGAVLVATDKAVLTAGVMVGLALVPGAAISGMALAVGEFSTALDGLERWTTDAAILLAVSVLVLVWKRLRVQRRPMLY